MSAHRTLAEIYADAARALEPTHPELAAEILALKPPGRPKEDGEHNERLADEWEKMADFVESLLSPRVNRKEAQVQMIAEFRKRPTIIAHRGDKESALWDLWDLKGRPAVRQILRVRGRI